MSTKNPIVGLAFVVTSQQEMLEAKLQEIEALHNDLSECKRKYNELQESKDECIAQIRLEAETARLDALHDIEGLQDELEKTRQQVKAFEELLQNARDQSDYFSGEYNRVNTLLLDLQVQQETFRKRYGWRKWTPDAEYDFDRFGMTPQVDGMYLYSEDSKEKFYDNIDCQEHCFAGKYSLYSVRTVYNQVGRCDKFKIEPDERLSKDGAQLVAIRIFYNDEFMLLDSFQCEDE